MKHRSFALPGLRFFIFSFCPTGFSQMEFAGISGSVLDASGARISVAIVHADSTPSDERAVNA
jgi:hypothetical protein